MTRQRRFGEYFDVRPGEGRLVTLSIAGAFLVVAILIMARAMREAAFLGQYPVERLPYIIAAVAAASLPVIAVFSRFARRWRALTMLRGQLVVQVCGLAALWWILDSGRETRAAVVAFYLWTALGSLLVASSFWILVAETFPLRGAKRLYGLVSAGGTAGALIAGFFLKWVSSRLADPLDLLPVLLTLLAAFAVLLLPWPRPPFDEGREAEARQSGKMRGGLALILKTPHLRLIAFMVMSATAASTLLDYQFKEVVNEACASAPEPDAALAGFFGAFYGWTGAIALLIQLTLAGRLIASFGIATVLSMLPVLLILGSGCFALLPVLLVITLLRGTDYTLRKALFRPMVEVLYLPLDIGVRRRTKTLIDTALDTVAEGIGAGFIVLWITVWSLPSRFFSLFVAVAATVFILLSRRMDRQYLQTVVARLHEGEDALLDNLESPSRQDNLLSAGFTRLHISSVMQAHKGHHDVDGSRSAAPAAGREQLRSAPAVDVRRVLENDDGWDDAGIDVLISLLVREDVLVDVRAKLRDLGDVSISRLLDVIKDEGGDLVIRRRIPWILADIGGVEVDEALLDALLARNFELRYRAAVALIRRRKTNVPCVIEGCRKKIWNAVRLEISKSMPVWELQKLNDEEEHFDDLVLEHIDRRGRLSLEHTFRLLSLVLEAEPVRAAYRGIVMDDGRLRNYSLEYLEQVLPTDVRKRLWLLIGDINVRQEEKARRPIEKIVDDLLVSQTMLFAGDREQQALRDLLGQNDPTADDEDRPEPTD